MFDPATVAAIVLKTSLLVVGIGVIAILSARKSAALRHLLWAAALALSLLMPFAVVHLPAWVHVALPWEIAEPWPRNESGPVAAGVGNAGAESVVTDPRRDAPPAARRMTSLAWPTLMIVWLVGALVVLLRNAFAHIGLTRWMRMSRPGLSPAWDATLRRAANEAGFHRPVRAFESDQAFGPCTFGFFRPILLLPAVGAGWPEAQRRLTVLHEIAHIRRLDYLTTQIASIACAVHWYNPIVWYAAIQARKLQEQACDDAVLNAGGMPSDYAQLLVSLAGGSRSLSPQYPAAVGMVQRSQLHGRVTAILDSSRARQPLRGFALVAALAALAGLMLFLATLAAAAAPTAMQPGVPLTASFTSVELRNGGEVNLVHGESRAVNLLKGDLEQSSITIDDNGRLVIDRCPTYCPRNHDFEVEVVTPALSAIAVAEGGTMRTADDFPPQPEIGVSVSQGGVVDIRSLPVASVTASVYSGGRIFTRPGAALSADVEQGGNITYWGNAVVKSSVRHGGVVAKGAVADADKLLVELMSPQFIEPPAPIPPVPPVASILPTGH